MLNDRAERYRIYESNNLHEETSCNNIIKLSLSFLQGKLKPLKRLMGVLNEGLTR